MCLCPSSPGSAGRPAWALAVHVCRDEGHNIAWACWVGGVHAKSPKSMELWRCEGGREKSELKANKDCGALILRTKFKMKITQ